MGTDPSGAVMSTTTAKLIEALHACHAGIVATLEAEVCEPALIVQLSDAEIRARSILAEVQS